MVRVLRVPLLVLTVQLLAVMAAHAASGSLKVTSFPAGAKVYVDGADTGKTTPMSVSVSVGTHVVKVQIPGSGWAPAESTATIVEGNNDLSVTLLPALTQGPEGPPGPDGPQGPQGPPGLGLQSGSIAGQVALCSGLPTGSRIYVSGHSFSAITGAAGSFELSYVPPGSYEVVVEIPDQAPVTIPAVAVNPSHVTNLGQRTPVASDPNHCGSCDKWCGAGGVCSGGACSDASCTGVLCPDGLSCVGGVCINAVCVGVACPVGSSCFDGVCISESCIGVTCPVGMFCSDGACI